MWGTLYMNMDLLTSETCDKISQVSLYVAGRRVAMITQIDRLYEANAVGMQRSMARLFMQMRMAATRC